MFSYSAFLFHVFEVEIKVKVFDRDSVHSCINYILPTGGAVECLALRLIFFVIE